MPSSSWVPRLVSTDETEEKGLRIGREGKRKEKKGGGFPVGKASRRKALEGRGARRWVGGCSERVVVVAEGPREKIREKEGHETSRPRRLLRIRLSSGPLPSYSLSLPSSFSAFHSFPALEYIPFSAPVFHAEHPGSNPRGHRPNHHLLVRLLCRGGTTCSTGATPCETSPNKVPGAFRETASIFRSLHLRLSVADLRHRRRSGNLTTDHRTGPKLKGDAPLCGHTNKGDR